MCEIYSELTKQDTRTLAWLFVVNFGRIFASCFGISIFQVNTGWVLQLEFLLNYLTNSSPEKNILCPFSKIYFSVFHAIDFALQRERIDVFVVNVYLSKNKVSIK